MTRVVTVLVCMSLALLWASSARAQAGEYGDPQSGIVLRLPQGWQPVPIDKDALDLVDHDRGGRIFIRRVPSLLPARVPKALEEMASDRAGRALGLLVPHPDGAVLPVRILDGGTLRRGLAVHKARDAKDGPVSVLVLGAINEDAWKPEFDAFVDSLAGSITLHASARERSAERPTVGGVAIAGLGDVARFGPPGGFLGPARGRDAWAVFDDDKSCTAGVRPLGAFSRSAWPKQTAMLARDWGDAIGLMVAIDVKKKLAAGAGTTAAAAYAWDNEGAAYGGVLVVVEGNSGATGVVFGLCKKGKEARAKKAALEIVAAMRGR